MTYCFNDLGGEQNAHFYGNECNVLAEILLDRYDWFVTHQMRTYPTSNLTPRTAQLTPPRICAQLARYGFRCEELPY